MHNQLNKRGKKQNDWKKEYKIVEMQLKVMRRQKDY